jgi:hypothetical protein
VEVRSAEYVEVRLRHHRPRSQRPLLRRLTLPEVAKTDARFCVGSS